MTSSDFRLTYATMFDPPAQLHELFEEALEKLRPGLGGDYPLTIGGGEVFCDGKFEDRSPTDKNLVLGTFQQGGASEAERVVASARAAFPVWSGTPWQERVKVMRRVAELIRERSFIMAAAVTLSVGKNRMEALGDVVETADLVDYACDQMEKNQGFITELDRDPLVNMNPRNVSWLRPYGPWLVVSPFNFPGALTGGPAGAALVTGNTVVVKCSSDTPLGPRLLADCFLDAGLPEGAFNFVTGPGGSLGQALIDNPDLAGVTFTGSHQVGMEIHRTWAQRPFVHPVILELGGKNPIIVLADADIEYAVKSAAFSAYLHQGEICMSTDRIIVEKPIVEAFSQGLAELASHLPVGDPSQPTTFIGPVINDEQIKKIDEHVKDAVAKGAKLLTGGKYEGRLYEPTLLADVTPDMKIYYEETFGPVASIIAVENVEEALKVANDTTYGLSAGAITKDLEKAIFLGEGLEAGMVHINDGSVDADACCPFGGCKGSGHGREGGHYSVEELTELKWLTIQKTKRQLPF